MEIVLPFLMNLVALAIAGVALTVAILIGTGGVEAVRHPVARIVLTSTFAVLGVWILFHGIWHAATG